MITKPRGLDVNRFAMEGSPLPSDERQIVSDSSPTLGQQVYQALREQLLQGEWLPGTKLTLRALAGELGTSIQPVREAIQRLTAEKALVLRPNHSIIIPTILKSILDEIWALRATLESEAARLCAPLLTDEDFEQLDRAMAAIRRHHSPGGDRSQRVRAVHTIALLTADRSGSHSLSDQIHSLRVRSAPYYAAAMASDEVEETEFTTFTIRLQDEFIQALKRRDAQNAMHLRQADLYTYQQYIYRRLGVSQSC